MIIQKFKYNLKNVSLVKFKQSLIENHLRSLWICSAEGRGVRMS